MKTKQKHSNETTFNKVWLEKTSFAAHASDARRALQKLQDADLDAMQKTCILLAETVIQKMSMPTDQETIEIQALFLIENALNRIELAEMPTINKLLS